MAHIEQLDFVSRIGRLLPRYFSRATVLEIGSLDINGTIRSAFTNCQYTGIDVAAGPGVDVVCEGQQYDAADDSFDIVISCEVMEHNPHWVETFKNMVRLSKRDGLIVMTCGSLGRPEHGTSRSNIDASPLTVSKGWEYYRNLAPRDFINSGCVAGLCTWKFFENWRAYDLYFVGSKSRLDPAAEAQLSALERHYRAETFKTAKGLRRYLKAKYLLRK
ncbi:MAG TPA: class I SAM-dependent methyltransferase [Anaeromyxobacteraceae bacterium]|nr:class I SAM-dependent methyltransferase [Anaeromyxobacteraceae bacterium]